MILNTGDEAMGQGNTPSVVEELIQKLRTEDRDTWESTARALVAVGASAIIPLLRVLTEEVSSSEYSDEDLELIISDILTWIGSPAVPELIRFVQDDEQDAEQRATIAEILGDIGNPAAVESLIYALQDPDSEYLRGQAASALGKLHDPRAVNPLVAALTDEDSDMRFFAAEALGRLGDHQALAALIQALDDHIPEVRKQVALALGMLGAAEAIPALLRCWERESVRTFAGREVKGAIADAVEQIRQQAALGDETATWYDLLTLGEREQGRPVDDLLARLQSSEQRERRKAAVGLGLLADRQAVEPLISALQDADADLRWYVVEALGRIGDERALAALAWSAGNDNWQTSGGRWVSEAAATALKHILVPHHLNLATLLAPIWANRIHQD